MTKLVAIAATVLVLGVSVSQAAPMTGTSPATETGILNVIPIHSHHHRHDQHFDFHGQFRDERCYWTLYGYQCS